MKKIDFKKFLPHIIAIVLFISITMIYFSPLIEGKSLPQMDMTHAKGMSQELKSYHEQTNEYSQWTNSMFSGMPAYNVSRYGSVNNIFYFLLKFVRLNLPALTMGIVFIYLLGFYILLVSMRVNSWLSIVGAFAFSFSSYNFIIILVGHVSKAYAIAYMAPVLAGVLLTYRGKYLMGGLLTTIALGLEIASNHPQITYYLAMVIGLFIVVKFIFSVREKVLKDFFIATAFVVIAVIFAILPSTTTLLTSYEMGKESIRGETELTTKKQQFNSTGLDKDYAFAWSYGKAETFTMLIPNLMGGGSSSAELDESSEIYKVLQQNGIQNAREITKQAPTYWGEMPFTSGTVYFGAIVCFLFVLGLFIVKGYIKWWLLIVTVLAIFLSWGKNLMWFSDIFFNYLPMYNKFRAVSTTLVIASLTMPLLAFLALKNIFDANENKKHLLKSLKISLAIVGGITLIFALVPAMFFDFSASSDAQLIAKGFPDWFINALHSERKSLLQKDAWRSLLFIILSGGLIWLFLKNKIKVTYIIISIGVLMLIDLWQVDKRVLNEDCFVLKHATQNEFIASTADIEILKDNNPNYRVLNLNNPFNEVNTSYFHKSIGGYHGAKLRRYQELIDTSLSKEINNFGSVLSNKPTDSSITAGLKKLSTLNMLNTRYIIYNPEAQPLRNKFALGNAWFVNDMKLVSNAEEELKSLNNLDPAITAIVDKRFEPIVSSYKQGKDKGIDTTASIVFKTYKPNYLEYHSQSLLEQLAVFSEIYYPHGWNAYIDGKLTSHFRANFILRAMIVPAGTHKIEFKFEPKQFYVAQATSMFGSIAVCLFIIVILFIEIRKRYKRI